MNYWTLSKSPNLQEITNKLYISPIFWLEVIEVKIILYIFR